MYSVTPMRVILHAKTETKLSLNSLISQQKVIDDAPHSSISPSHKYAMSDLTARSTTADMLRIFPQERSKRKTEGSAPEGSLPPSFKRRTLTRSYAMSDLTMSLAFHMLRIFPQERSKRKTEGSAPEGSLPPSFKRRTLTRSYAMSDLTMSLAFHMLRIFPQERSKCKTEGSAPEGSLPPSFKKCALSHTCANANLTTYSMTAERTADLILSHRTHSRAVTLNGRTISPIPLSCWWPFPNELLLIIFGYLPAIDLMSITQVSVLLKDLAAPLYFQAVGLHVEQTWLRVNAQSCLALLLYTRTTSFCVPRFLHCDLHGSVDRDLTALQTFLEFLKGIQSKPMSSSGIWAAPASDIQAEIQNTHSPAVFSRLAHVFSPRVASFTLATLRDSPLSDLSLTNTALSGIQWAMLLPNVHLPLLRMLTVDIECPPAVLAGFLACHQNVTQVWIHPGQTLSLPILQQKRSSQKLRSQTSHQSQSTLDLSVLGGPLWYIASLLTSVYPAPCIRRLSLRFEENFIPNYLSAILDITQHFTAIQALKLSFFDASHAANCFDVLFEEHRIVHAKSLNIAVYGPDPDDLMVHCRPWLNAFHGLECVELQARHLSGTSEKLGAIFSCPDKPFQLKISNGDM
ncbi:uncharacterized protein F5891DRAFT_1193616 [Suillus fuscotomentosus]|uniref:F-box domain-containing protein n=1 Tax=Suillus fuscotomentosus TaxID=1912939 RepID=A0AAD4DXL8_9AGAM|nr:uncharacterized protein F5891DRAFT_1193616 [Suillus fuscotomentosus]KAG1895986.1 hypothetical protein F5891DRAFT_1193616 [Suillus fuscotomentosus]